MTCSHCQVQPDSLQLQYFSADKTTRYSSTRCVSCAQNTVSQKSPCGWGSSWADPLAGFVRPLPGGHGGEIIEEKGRGREAGGLGKRISVGVERKEVLRCLALSSQNPRPAAVRRQM